ncbi:MAG: hypothetical protein ACREQ2_13475 [Candidatus Binatia bacterium]
MERGLFLIGLLIVLIAVYRWVARRPATPQSTVRFLLRRYHAFQRMGLSEQESLFRILTSRRGWRNLPAPFLAEIVARLKSKEDVMRFVSLAEGYRLTRERLPDIASNKNIESAMRQLAIWLVNFGNQLQSENRLKQAEFVQKLALGLQPEKYFTKLPLATTYYKMGHYADAVPLFEEGFALLENFADESTPHEQGLYPADGLAPGTSVAELKAAHKPVYEACLDAIRPKRENPPRASS